MGVRISISTGSLYGASLDRTLAIVAASGADGVEVLLTEGMLAAGPGALLAAAERHGVRLLSVHFPILGRRDLSAELAAYERTAAFAAEVRQCEAVVVHTPVIASLHGAAGQEYLLTLQRLRERLGGSGARLAVENRGVGRPPARGAYLDSLERLRQLAEEWDLGLTFDIPHAASWGLDPVQALGVLGGRVCNVHLHNQRSRSWLLDLPGLRGHLRDHQPLAVGVLPLAVVVEALVARQYAGLLTLEFSPIGLHLHRPGRAGEALAEAVRTCRQWLADAPGASGPRRPPRRHRAPTDPA
jgi:sugar phosphate isomerase/epimerase